jgi:hypothetical protein
MTGRQPTEAWVAQQVLATGFADVLSETSDRLAGRRLLAIECEESGQDATSLLPPGTPNGLYVLRTSA